MFEKYLCTFCDKKIPDSHCTNGCGNNIYEDCMCGVCDTCFDCCYCEYKGHKGNDGSLDENTEHENFVDSFEKYVCHLCLDEKGEYNLAPFDNGDGPTSNECYECYKNACEECWHSDCERCKVCCEENEECYEKGYERPKIKYPKLQKLFEKYLCQKCLQKGKFHSTLCEDKGKLCQTHCFHNEISSSEEK